MKQSHKLEDMPDGKIAELIEMLDPRRFDQNMKKLGPGFDETYCLALRRTIVLLKTIPMLRKKNKELAEKVATLEKAEKRLDYVRILVDDEYKHTKPYLCERQYGYAQALQKVESILYASKQEKEAFNSAQPTENTESGNKKKSA